MRTVWFSCSLGYGEPWQSTRSRLQTLCPLPALCAFQFHREPEDRELHVPASFASWLSLRSCQGDGRWEEERSPCASSSGGSLWAPEVSGVPSTESEREGSHHLLRAGGLPSRSRQFRQHQNSGSVLRLLGYLAPPVFQTGFVFDKSTLMKHDFDEFWWMWWMYVLNFYFP